MVNNLTPTYLSSLVPLTVTEASRYNLRNSSDIRTVNARISQYFNSFLPSSIREWNSLPEEHRTSSTVTSLSIISTSLILSYQSFIMLESAKHRCCIPAYGLNVVHLITIYFSKIWLIHLYVYVAMLKMQNIICSIVICTGSLELKC